MSYDIRLMPDAEKMLGKLNELERQRIINVLERIRERPFVFVKKLTGVKYFSARAGKFKIILDIRRKELVIIVIDIGMRRNVYDNLK